MNHARLATCSCLSLLTLSILSACGLGAPQPGADVPEDPPSSAPAAPVTPASAPASASTAKAVNAGECTKVPLVDDAEDTNNQISVADKRGGYWYTYADTQGTTINPTGTFTVSEGGAEGSKLAARMSGKVGTKGDVFYAGMGFSLTEPKALYDASCCKGVSFWAKKAGTSTAAVRFKIGDVNTTPEGGVCKQCYNDFGTDLTLTSEWKKYEIAFADMKQEGGWGDKYPAIDASRLFQLQWQVKEPGAEYDIWVDKIEFVGCGG